VILLTLLTLLTLLPLLTLGEFTIPRDVDDDVADLIRSMLTVDVTQRIQVCVLPF
jgi:hypothetical protein